MALSDRIRQLEPRERQLLGILGTVFAVVLLLLVPVGVTALLGSQRSNNEALREAIEAIQQGREQVASREKERKQVTERYANKVDALAGWLEKLATQSNLEIPESQDQAVVPHGKRFDERSTKIVLRKVGMLNLVKFMERIAQSGQPVSITRLNIRKRATEPDSFDVEMVVATYDRKATEERDKKKGAAADKPEKKDEEPAP